MTARYPLVLNGTQLQELQSGDSLSGDGSSLINISLTAGVTGTLPVSKGGTGFVTLASGRIPYGDTANPLASNSLFVFDGTNLGIGTATPTAKLDVLAPTGNNTVAFRATTGNSCNFEIAGNGNSIGVTSFFFGQDSSSNAFLWNRSNAYLSLGLNNAEKLRLDTTGKVWQIVNATTTSNYYGWGDITTTYAAIGGYRDSATTGHLELYTLTSGTVPTEQVRIDSAGNTYNMNGQIWHHAPAPTVITGITTLTAAQLQTDIISTTGGTYTITLPTGAAIDAAFVGTPSFDIGFDFHIVNTATGIITVAVGATGMTPLGPLTVAAANSAAFRLRRTAASTYILYRLS